MTHFNHKVRSFRHIVTDDIERKFQRGIGSIKHHALAGTGNGCTPRGEMVTFYTKEKSLSIV